MLGGGLGLGFGGMARIPSSMSTADLDRVLPQLVDRGLPGGGEFLVAEVDENSPVMIATLVWHGFLPMGGMGLLLPKIHEHRCLLEPDNMHVGKKVRKRTKRGHFHLTVSKAWPEVVRGIQEHTFTEDKGDCWLSDELAKAWLAVNSLDDERRRGVSFHSVELWHTASCKLVAGEIGYTCGGVYSSCTGFTLKDEYPGSGSVQLAALGRWLVRCGFQLWDLGMELDYKVELGGQTVRRSEWARRSRALRLEQAAALRSPDGAEAGDATNLITQGGSPEGSGLQPPSKRPTGAAKAPEELPDRKKR